MEKVNEYDRHYLDIYTKGYSMKQGNEIGSGFIVHLNLLTHLVHSNLLHLRSLKKT